MATISIIGSGAVGQATGRGFASWGHQVVYCDIDPDVLAGIRKRGERAVTPDALIEIPTDVTFISVATPTVDGHIFLEPLRAAIATAARRLSSTSGKHVIVMRCTLPPGSTSNIVIPLLEDISGLTYGDDFGVCYNPEFLREASALEDFLNPKLVVIGAEEPYSLSTLEEVYAAGLPQGIRSVTTDFKTAEMIKFTSNLFNATKISFTNEMWLACRRLGIDGDEVMSTVVEACEGFWNPGYGSRGGYPYGGACLPKDTAAFYTFARSLGLSMELLNSVIAINDRMAELIHWESPMSQQRGLNFDPASVHGYRPAIAPQQAGRTR